MFPYIKNDDDDTVMFGYILSKGSINTSFFIISVTIISFCVWIFFCHIFVIYEGNNNPYAAYSIELNCSMKIDLPEAISQKQKNDSPQTTCENYTINLNMAGAAGQATGALALGWVISSIFTWLIVNACFICKSKNRNCCENNSKIIVAIVLIVIILFLVFTVLAYIIYMAYGHLQVHAPAVGTWKDIICTWYALIPEYLLIIIIPLATIMGVTTSNIKKNTKIIEEYCKEIIQKERATEEQKQQAFKRIYGQLVGYKLQQTLAKKVHFYVDKEEIFETVRNLYMNTMGINQNFELIIMPSDTATTINTTAAAITPTTTTATTPATTTTATTPATTTTATPATDTPATTATTDINYNYYT